VRIRFFGEQKFLLVDMVGIKEDEMKGEKILLFLALVVMFLGGTSLVGAATIPPSEFWKEQIVWPDDPFRNYGLSSEDNPSWVKFTILQVEGYDPNIVYFQDSQEYLFHYDFAVDCLTPFFGMSTIEFDQLTLYEENQQAVLGAVLFPPMRGIPSLPTFAEYGIQFVRYDAYTREEVAGMFNLVKSNVIAEPGVVAIYFPSYEQTAVAEANEEWFALQGIPIGSVAHWLSTNIAYSEGWALGRLNYVPPEEIRSSYLSGELVGTDILLTDGVPAEVPYVAGIISLEPSTPNSHVAILSQTYGVPFLYLALAEDAQRAMEMVGKTVAVRCYTAPYQPPDIKIIDASGLEEGMIDEILALKEPKPLNISPIQTYGDYSASVDGLLPDDICYFGGKAANFGMIRAAIGGNCPIAAAFSFDLWNDFLDQTLTSQEGVTIGPGEYLLFWADNDEEQGPTHTNFKLSADGEFVGLYDRDGVTLIDGISFGAQSADVSYGRLPDGEDNWVFFGEGSATPGWSNSGGGPEMGVFINEFMAENETTIQDPDGEGYPDWIEIYNAGTTTIELGGMYLTDDANDPTKWMIPISISGGTLRKEINSRLSSYSYPPSDMAALSADLAAIREGLFKNTFATDFKQQLRNAVINTLDEGAYGFDPNSNIRFRSSTNVEDSEQFTGAGLYDSFSGCLVDDLDGDEVGPCSCDPEENNERGVFRAIRKVFASFYNDNAFLERLRHNINEDEVGMALLVHHSFPDEFELANGVATFERVSANTDNITLVTQLGAVPVTNPEDGPLPEKVKVRVTTNTGTNYYTTLLQYSSLVPLGGTVMEWQDDYIGLAELLVAVADEYALVTGKGTFLLDFEYKKLSPGGAAIPAGGLVVKQVRPLPQADTTANIMPFMINEPSEYCLFQGEYADIFAHHRLKSRWQVETNNLWLNKPNLVDSFIPQMELDYTAASRLRNLYGEPALWPFGKHSSGPSYWPGAWETFDDWRMHHLPNPRNYRLHTDYIPMAVSEAESPLLTIQDFELTAELTYDKEELRWTYEGTTKTLTDTVMLCPCFKPESNDKLQQRIYDDGKVSMEINFYWPPDLTGWVAGYTAPLSSWVETIIEGYTTEPIVLHGWYSQTYRPEHHNFSEHFMFEPKLEPGISESILEELAAKDIRLIHLFHERSSPQLSILTTYGFEETDFIAGDVNRDKIVNLTDVVMFAENWLDRICDECNRADMTGDGNVLIDDYAEIAENWLCEI
jgi:hypothetical protein